MSKGEYTESALNNAVRRVKFGELSEQQAAAQYGIPIIAIYEKITKRWPPDESDTCPFELSTCLSEAEEATIASWAINMSRIGCRKTRSQIFQMALEIIREGGRETPFTDDKPLQKSFASLLKKFPQLSIQKSQALAKERTELTSAKMEKWFEELENYLKEVEASSILTAPDRMWNADESAFAVSRKPNITTLVAGSASGILCPPFIVHPWKQWPWNWMPPRKPGNWFYGRGESGQVTARMFYCWVANHFRHFLQSQEIQFPVLLLVDWHGSPVNHHVAQLCKDNQIILYQLPAHSSYVIQPLELSFFGPLKEVYRKEETQWKDDHQGKRVTRAAFAGVFVKTWSHMRREHVTSGFRAAGLFPYTRKYTTREKLAPSRVIVGPSAPQAPGSSSPSSTSSAQQPTPSSNSTTTAAQPTATVSTQTEHDYEPRARRDKIPTRSERKRKWKEE